MVLGFEDETSVVRGGDNERGDSAESEVDDGTKFVSESGEG